jgi:hypothetical protein
VWQVDTWGALDTSAKKLLLPPFTSQWMRHHDFSAASCAVVGNSGNLLMRKFGAAIDRHDLVRGQQLQPPSGRGQQRLVSETQALTIGVVVRAVAMAQVVRLNQAPTAGYASTVGTKTSFRVLNPTWQSRYGEAKLVSPDQASEPLPQPRRRRRLQSWYRSNATRLVDPKSKPSSATTTAATTHKHTLAHMVKDAVPSVSRTRPSAGAVRAREEVSSGGGGGGGGGLAAGPRRHEVLLARTRDRHEENRQRLQQVESERVRHQVRCLCVSKAGADQSCWEACSGTARPQASPGSSAASRASPGVPRAGRPTLPIFLPRRAPHTVRSTSAVHVRCTTTLPTALVSTTRYDL